jgi:hypothetical protein
LDDFNFFVSKNTGSLRQDCVKPKLNQNIRVVKNWSWLVKCMGRDQYKQLKLSKNQN